MAHGHTNTGIKQTLHPSSSTVQKHFNAIFAKLGHTEEPVHGRVAAVLTYQPDSGIAPAQAQLTSMPPREEPRHDRRAR